MKLKARKNELSPVVHRNWLEVTPDGVDENEWKKFRNAYNRGAKLLDNEYPAQLDIELNADCNYKCKFCIQSVRNMGTYQLGFDNFEKLITEAIEMGTRSLKLNYMNEPLLLPDLEDYIIYAKKAGMINIFFSTNGSLLTAERSASLIKAGVTKIFISIDSVNARMYAKQRRQANYELVVENTKKFIEIRNSMGLKYPLVRVNFLKNAENIGHEKEFIKIWEGIADMIIIQEMNELIDNTSGIFLNTDKTDYKCSFPFKQLVVDARGRILPCCCMNGIGHQIGHMKNLSLKEAWNSPKIEYLRNLHKNGDFMSDEICRRCITGK